MKNLRVRMLSMGVLSAVMISSVPVFAATNSSKTENKIVSTTSASVEKAKTSATEKVKTTSTSKIKAASWDDRTVDEILDDGGVIEYGDEGFAVEQIQQDLYNLGFYRGNIDGDFGSSTRSAVKKFQEDQNGYLTVDGVVGKKTWTYLKARQD